MVKDEIDLRERFDTQVRLRLAATHCDEDEAAACLERLTKCVTAASKETLPVKQHRPMRKRYVSDRTRQLYESAASTLRSSLTMNAGQQLVQLACRAAKTTEITWTEC